MWSFPLFPDQASTSAWHLDALFVFEVLVAGFFTGLIFLLIVSFAVRYRRGTAVNRARPPLKGRAIEVFWIGVPLLLELVMFVWAAILFYHVYEPPPGALEIYVVGKQWMWYTQHSEGRAEINELHVPLGQPIKLTMTSQDVIHSFFIPAFRVKQDAQPGRYTETWFTATIPGRYQLLCTEYCGAQHSKMWGEVVVMAPEAFDEWIKEQQRGLVTRQDVLADEDQVNPQGDLAEMGKRVAVEQGCLRCHSVNDAVYGTEQHIGPTWVDLYQRPTKLDNGTEIIADEAYLTESMMDPNAKIVAGYTAVMPSYQGKLSGPETAAVVEYIKSLRSDRVRQASVKGPLYEPVR